VKAFLAAVAAVVVLGLAAALVLSLAQRPAYQVFATQATRVGDPGSNLVGGHWSGNPGKDPISDPHGNRQDNTRQGNG